MSGRGHSRPRSVGLALSTGVCFTPIVLQNYFRAHNAKYSFTDKHTRASLIQNTDRPDSIIARCAVRQGVLRQNPPKSGHWNSLAKCPLCHERTHALQHFLRYRGQKALSMRHQRESFWPFLAGLDMFQGKRFAATNIVLRTTSASCPWRISSRNIPT